MIAPDQESRHAGLGINTAIVIAWSGTLSPIFMAVGLVAVVGFGAYVLKQNRLIFVGYCALIILAGYGFIYLRQDLGIVWLLWLLLVVIASDVGGYVAGRMLGGPKFWPKVSPKKTWSGTIAGWIGAALVGLYFSVAYGLSGDLWLVSVLVAFAAQMGDIAESAIKRKTGIKDSSNLIPCHGGFMDRFDGMLGASLVVILLVVLTGLPHGAG